MYYYRSALFGTLLDGCLSLYPRLRFLLRFNYPPGVPGSNLYCTPQERELISQLRQIYSNLDMCRQDINRIVENFHDRIVRHHPRLQRNDSPTRLDARNIGSTINSLLEGYHSQVRGLPWLPLCFIMVTTGGYHGYHCVLS